MKSNKLFSAVMATAVFFGSAILPFDKAQYPMAFQTVSAAEKDPDTVNLHIGDVNGDGSIDSSDAADILREYAASLTGQDSVLTDSQKKLADLNSDSSIDSSDASLILMYYSYTATGGELSIEDYLNYLNTPPPVTTTTASAKTTSQTTSTTTSTRVTRTTARISSQNTASKTTAKTTAKPTAQTSTIPTKTSTTTVTKAPTTTATKPPTTTAAKPTATTTEPPVTTNAAEPVRVTSIGVTRSELSINVGEGALAAYVTMFPLNAENKDEIWTSSDESVAIVNSEGWVSGIGEGECTITVKSADNPEVSAEIKLTVINTRNVKSIRLSRTTMTIQAGYGELAARVTMLPETAINKDEIWTSSDESVATVDGEGWVIAKSAGNAVITVKSVDNPAVFAFVLVTVVDPQSVQTTPVTTEPPLPVTTTTTATAAEVPDATTTTGVPVAVQGIQVSESEITLAIGEQNEPAVKVLPENAANKALIWTSSNDQIAAVDRSGKISAVSTGNCTITVCSAENVEIKANILVNVKGAEEVTEINLSKYEMTITVGQLDISCVTMLPSTASNKDEIWTTSDPSVATVDKYGWVKGISEGECTITVKSVDNPSVKAEIAVTVVNEAIDNPITDFSYIAPGKSTQNEIAFLLPFPANAKGKYSVEYIITAKNGKVSSITTPALVIPTVKSAITMLTAETNEFTAEAYLTDLNTNQRAKIGSYSFRLNPRDAKTESESIYYAFYLLGGIEE